MKLEQYLIVLAETPSLLKKVEVIGITLEEESPKLVYKVDGKPKKIDISFIESLSDTYEHYLWCHMLAQGYTLVYVENGWIVKGPNEDYQLDENTCTCPAGTYKPGHKCKHLMFRDAEMRYRSKQSQYRNSLQLSLRN